MQGVATEFLDSLLKICKSLLNYSYRVTDISSYEKRLESSLDHTLEFFPKLSAISFQEYMSKLISHLLACTMI